MLDNLRKCHSCGKLFGYMGRPICPACLKKLDEEFSLVRNYVYDHPDVGVDEVSRETEVSVKTIKQFLREGRLQLRNADGALLCENCGKPLTSGTLCQDCKGKLMSTLDSTLPKPEVKKKESGGKDGFKGSQKLHIDINRK